MQQAGWGAGCGWVLKSQAWRQAAAGGGQQARRAGRPRPGGGCCVLLAALPTLLTRMALPLALDVPPGAALRSPPGVVSSALLQPHPRRTRGAESSNKGSPLRSSCLSGPSHSQPQPPLLTTAAAQPSAAVAGAHAVPAAMAAPGNAPSCLTPAGACTEHACVACSLVNSVCWCHQPTQPARPPSHTCTRTDRRAAADRRCSAPAARRGAAADLQPAEAWLLQHTAPPSCCCGLMSRWEGAARLVAMRWPAAAGTLLVFVSAPCMLHGVAE